MNELLFDFSAPVSDVHTVNPVGQVLPPYQRGSVTSRAAAIKAQAFVGEQGARVLAWIVGRGTRGGTQREGSEALAIGRPSACARFRALERTHAILKTGTRRRGCAVYQAITPFVNQEEQR